MSRAAIDTILLTLHTLRKEIENTPSLSATTDKINETIRLCGEINMDLLVYHNDLLDTTPEPEPQTTSEPTTTPTTTPTTASYASYMYDYTKYVVNEDEANKIKNVRHKVIIDALRHIKSPANRKEIRNTIASIPTLNTAYNYNASTKEKFKTSAYNSVYTHIQLLLKEKAISIIY